MYSMKLIEKVYSYESYLVLCMYILTPDMEAVATDNWLTWYL